MNSRETPPDSLDSFPTPPWATRGFEVEGLGDIERWCKPAPMPLFDGAAA